MRAKELAAIIAMAFCPSQWTGIRIPPCDLHSTSTHMVFTDETHTFHVGNKKSLTCRKVGVQGYHHNERIELQVLTSDGQKKKNELDGLPTEWNRI